jgi:hypothetical protein
MYDTVATLRGGPPVGGACARGRGVILPGRPAWRWTGERRGRHRLSYPSPGWPAPRQWTFSWRRASAMHLVVRPSATWTYELDSSGNLVVAVWRLQWRGHRLLPKRDQLAANILSTYMYQYLLWTHYLAHTSCHHIFMCKVIVEEHYHAIT